MPTKPFGSSRTTLFLTSTGNSIMDTFSSNIFVAMLLAFHIFAATTWKVVMFFKVVFSFRAFFLKLAIFSGDKWSTRIWFWGADCVALVPLLPWIVNKLCVSVDFDYSKCGWLIFGGFQALRSVLPAFGTMMRSPPRVNAPKFTSKSLIAEPSSVQWL